MINRILSFLVVFVFAVALAIDTGEEAPNFRLATEDGQIIELAELKGEPVVVNFWATWCPTCQAELPHINTFLKDYPGLNALLISPSDPAMVAYAHITEKEWDSFTPLYDEFFLETAVDEAPETPAQVAKRWKIRGQPWTVVLDGEGVVVSAYMGPVNVEALADDLLLAGYTAPEALSDEAVTEDATN